MMQDLMTIEKTTHTLNVPGAVCTYDVRASDASDHRPLVLIGSPMGASGFPTLASHFTDRTVVTYDPRGIERSRRTDGVIESNPTERAEDVHRIIEALGIAPVDLLGSSGGAVDGLALVARHPEDVRVLVAHEPPLATLLPDRDAALAANRAIHDTYLQHGVGPGMAMFISLISHKGPVPADWTTQPAPDPAMFGLPTEDDGSRNDPLLGQSIIGTTSFEPDFDALRAASTRIVVAAGEESEGELANRGAYALAERLGQATVVFPSGHGGFQGDEYGMPGKPTEFAAKLREVLDAP
jgi:pimeloyl-ACP methyl ester carboxylesterase